MILIQSGKNELMWQYYHLMAKSVNSTLFQENTAFRVNWIEVWHLNAVINQF